MKSVTSLYRNRLALIFDFDGTLGPSTYDAILEWLGFEAKAFREENVAPLLEQGWETPLAQSYSLELISRGSIQRRDGASGPITSELLQSVGRGLELFPGVCEMFDRLRKTGRSKNDELEIEFYLVTAGFVEVVAATPIASEFRRIYGGAYHYNPETGGIDAVKRILTHPEKPRYIIQICKGKEVDHANPLGAEEPVPKEEWRIPLDQVIYVGDGMSDIPAFELIQKEGGIALGVIRRDSPEEWQARERLHTDMIVENLAPSDYGEDSELLKSLVLAVDSVAAKIALRRLSSGDDPAGAS